MQRPQFQSWTCLVRIEKHCDSCKRDQETRIFDFECIKKTLASLCEILTFAFLIPFLEKFFQKSRFISRERNELLKEKFLVEKNVSLLHFRKLSTFTYFDNVYRVQYVFTKTKCWVFVLVIIYNLIYYLQHNCENNLLLMDLLRIRAE